MSLHNLGIQYEFGRGVEKDLALAARYYQAAAEQNYPPSEYKLGAMFARGLGVPRDPLIAAFWYRKAAQHNVRPAQYHLAMQHLQGEGVEKNITEATFWFRKAVQNGHHHAKEMLAWLYRTQRIEIQLGDVTKYRQDYLLDIPEALDALKLSQSQYREFTCDYHYAMAIEHSDQKPRFGSEINKLMRSHPNEFFDAIMNDTLLSEKAKTCHLTRLYQCHNQTRSPCLLTRHIVPMSDDKLHDLRARIHMPHIELRAVITLAV